VLNGVLAGYSQALMANLGLPYTISFLGADEAPKAIRALLEAEAPALFYLWYLLRVPLEYSEYPRVLLEYP
jgi:hypothetical protein